MLVANGEADDLAARERRGGGGATTRDLDTGRGCAAAEALGGEEAAHAFTLAMERELPGLRQALVSSAAQRRRSPQEQRRSLLEQCQRRVRGEVEEMLERVAPPGSWDTRPGVELRRTTEGGIEVSLESIPGEPRGAPLLQLAEKLARGLLDGGEEEDPDAVERYLRDGAGTPRPPRCP